MRDLTPPPPSPKPDWDFVYAVSDLISSRAKLIADGDHPRPERAEHLMRIWARQLYRHLNEGQLP